MTDPKSLYVRIGGEGGIRSLVSDFYGRVFADPQLRPFFEGIEAEKLERMQREFFALALGGPSLYTGRSMAEAHYGRGIEPKHLRRFLDHLLATLGGRELSEDEIYDVMTRIEKLADDVTGTVGVDG